MRVEAGKDEVAGMMQARDERGQVIGCARGFDTDEKWLEVFIMNGSRCLVSGGAIVKAKIYINYDIFDKGSGTLLHSVRQ